MSGGRLRTIKSPMTIEGPYSSSWCRRAGGCSSVVRSVRDSSHMDVDPPSSCQNPSRKSTSSRFHVDSIHTSSPLPTILTMQVTLIVHGPKISTLTQFPSGVSIQAPAGFDIAKTPLVAFRRYVTFPSRRFHYSSRSVYHLKGTT